MKKEILDAPIRQELSDFLEKGESILWQNSPSSSSLEASFFLAFIFFSFPIGVILFFSYLFGFLERDLQQFYWPLIIILIILLSILSIIFLKQKKRKRTKYFITQNQILFQFKKLGKKEIYSIPFSKIDDIIIINFDPNIDFDNEYLDKKDLLGTIFIAVKNPKLIPFQTYNFENGEKRAQPTLELISTDEVAQLIRQGIKNANTPS